MAADVTLSGSIQVDQTLPAPTGITYQDGQVTLRMSAGVTLDGTTTPKASEASHARYTLSGGEAVIDLQAVPVVSAEPGTVADWTGLRVVAAYLSAPTDNTDRVVLGTGADQYPLVGTGWTLTLNPGESVGPIYKPGNPAVGLGTHLIRLSGPGEKLDVLLVAGPTS